MCTLPSRPRLNLITSQRTSNMVTHTGNQGFNRWTWGRHKLLVGSTHISWALSKKVLILLLLNVSQCSLMIFLRRRISILFVQSLILFSIFSSGLFLDKVEWNLQIRLFFFLHRHGYDNILLVQKKLFPNKLI